MKTRKTLVSMDNIYTSFLLRAVSITGGWLGKTRAYTCQMPHNSCITLCVSILIFRFSEIKTQSLVLVLFAFLFDLILVPWLLSLFNAIICQKSAHTLPSHHILCSSVWCVPRSNRFSQSQCSFILSYSWTARDLNPCVLGFSFIALTICGASNLKSCLTCRLFSLPSGRWTDCGWHSLTPPLLSSLSVLPVSTSPSGHPSASRCAGMEIITSRSQFPGWYRGLFKINNQEVTPSEIDLPLQVFW